MFEAAIPGQSLTSPPGKHPYERPPEINDPEEAIQMHLTRLSSEEMVEDIVDMLELDVDIVTLTEGILRSAVSEGIHSIDISLSIAPVIHEHIKTTADKAGIEYEEGLEDKEGKADRDRAVTIAKAKKRLAATDLEFDEDDSPKEPSTEIEEEPEGFVKRRT